MTQEYYWQQTCVHVICDGFANAAAPKSTTVTPQPKQGAQYETSFLF
jgi:hypothetical protein